MYRTLGRRPHIWETSAGLVGPIGLMLGAASVGGISALLLDEPGLASEVTPLLITVEALVLSAATAAILISEPSLHVRNPAALLLGYLALIYVVRPAYVLGTGMVGTPQLGIGDVSNMSGEVASTLVILVLATTFFLVGYALAPSKLLLPILRVPRSPKPAGIWILAFALAISCASAAIVTADLVSYPAGWQAALILRAQFFEGRTVLTWALQLYKFALLAWLAATLAVSRGPRKEPLWLYLVLWMPTLGFDFLTGSRGDLILKNLIPVALIFAATLKEVRSTLKLFAVAALAGLILFVSYRTVVRDITQSPSESASSLAGQNLLNAWTFIVAGDEASAFDYLAFTRAEVPRFVPYGGPQQAVAIVTSPIPRAILADKPTRTSTLLTELLRPVHFAQGGNLAMSAAAELYFIAGDIAVVVGFMFLGWVSGVLLKGTERASRLTSRPTWPLCFGAIAAGSLISVVRVDLGELFLTALALVLLVTFYLLTTRPPRASAVVAGG